MCGFGVFGTGAVVDGRGCRWRRTLTQELRVYNVLDDSKAVAEIAESPATNYFLSPPLPAGERAT